MDVTDLLQTFAEVGIGLTGFTGIIAAVRAGGTEGMSAEVRSTFVALISFSVTFVLFSLLPLLLMVRAPSAVVWRVAAGLLLALMVAFTVNYWRPGSPMRVRHRMEIPGGVIFFSAMTSLGLTALGLTGSLAPVLYASVLFFFLAMGLFNFIDLLSRQ